MKMITLPKRFFFAAIILSLLSCQSVKFDLKAEEEKLMHTSREWSKAAEARDIEKTLDYWAEDAILISAGEPVLRGKQAIRGMVEGSIKDPNFSISWEPVKVEISESGDMGYLIEDSKIKFKDSTGNVNVENFKTVTIWKKQKDGSWKNIIDVMSPTK